MVKSLLLLSLFLPLCLAAQQTNILSTNALAEQILLGNYSPADYEPATLNPAPTALAADLNARISPDSLRASILHLSSFGNRNSGADTLSATTGIGAARRWVYQKFTEFSAANEGRLIPSYLQFDQEICTMGQHRDIFAVLPGTDPTRQGVILVEGHIDSRCEVLCDTACVAEGVEDNATGTALVMELARVMSHFSYPNTLVFVVTIAEEQGLYGAAAFAEYMQQQNIPLRAVFNNDVIGGIICGKTSSPPSCPGLDDIDSTSVRMFSSGGFNSRHKQLARFIKLEYRENILPVAAVPMNLRVMSPEDRMGRGGDHIPFREHNYTAMRFTSANEHGDASVGPDYTDRQHSSRDVLGADTDNDGIVDSFFVDFNYLARNTVINANAAAMAAYGVPSPVDFTGSRLGNQLTVNILDTAQVGAYRIALRSMSNDWDTVYTLVGSTTGVFPCNATGGLFLSVGAVNAEGVESLFSGEKIIGITSSTQEPGEQAEPNIRLLANKPNPFDEATWLSFWVNEVPAYHTAVLQVTDLQGKIVATLPLRLQAGWNEMLYTHGYGVRGTFIYSLIIDGHSVAARQMVFAN